MFLKPLHRRHMSQPQARVPCALLFCVDWTYLTRQVLPSHPAPQAKGSTSILWPLCMPDQAASLQTLCAAPVNNTQHPPGPVLPQPTTQHQGWAQLHFHIPTPETASRANDRKAHRRLDHKTKLKSDCSTSPDRMCQPGGRSTHSSSKASTLKRQSSFPKYDCFKT